MYIIVDRKTKWVYHTCDNLELAHAYVNCKNLNQDAVYIIEFSCDSETIGSRYVGKLWKTLIKEYENENKQKTSNKRVRTKNRNI